jgi:hypothetical protein
VVAFAVVLIFLMEQSFENELLLMNVVLHAHVLAYFYSMQRLYLPTCVIISQRI